MPEYMFKCIESIEYGGSTLDRATVVKWACNRDT
jgi:hypothetical protein